MIIHDFPSIAKQARLRALEGRAQSVVAMPPTGIVIAEAQECDKARYNAIRSRLWAPAGIEARRSEARRSEALRLLDMYPNQTKRYAAPEKDGA